MGYDHQHRGDDDAYERYLRGMNASMRQKVALTAAHIGSEGRIADMGMGSGAGSLALASLYPQLEVVGVDVNPEMVERASESHQLANLSFVVGDIAEPVFEPGSVDTILDSSVLHHVTTFNGYDYQQAEKALRVQAEQLDAGGMLIVRDFVAPEDQLVTLELPDDDGDDTEDPSTCSTAGLFRRFSREFRAGDDNPGFVLREDEHPPRPGWRRFHTGHRLAIEFVLRKDYRRDWKLEVVEEYTYFTQREFEDVFHKLGLRVVASTPIRNPWIVSNRYRNKFEIRNTEGILLPTPPTNYLIAGEKVAPGQGTTFVEVEEVEPIDYIWMEHARDRQTGRIMDLVVRPNPTVDVLPFFAEQGRLYVLARRSYPRPIPCHQLGASPLIDGSSPVGYVTEPLNLQAKGRPGARHVSEALHRLAGIEPGQIRQFAGGCAYLPSPGGIEQLNSCVHVEIEPSRVERAMEDLSGFSTSGVVRAIEARQLLRAAQVSGLPDARLEVAVYTLLRQRGASPGPWIGAELAPSVLDHDPPQAELPRPGERRFDRASAEQSPGFLAVHASRFDELDASGAVVASQVREYVVPRTRSNNSISVALLWRTGQEVLMAVENRHLPAQQAYFGHSHIQVAPAWRLPQDIVDQDRAHFWLREQLRHDHGVEATIVEPLGGHYYPDAGVSPEVVFPVAALATGADPAHGKPLTWLPLSELAAEVGRSKLDGHLCVAALRAAHALGIPMPAPKRDERPGLWALA
ncbi:MAG: class I SAM-dependent methyltransferase [Deltaproteobacteria bacterium]|nr:class I SAM-dependent methyltransferase [Deltaproteobacteria bacterium]